LSANKPETLASGKPVLHYHYAGLTDTGMVRDHNEDAYKLPAETDENTLASKGHLYVLADGMGGHQKGEVASAVTIETINAEYYTSLIDINADRPDVAIINAMADAIEKANIEVMDATQGGGTTVVAAVLYQDTLVTMNVGDSRAYLLRDNQMYRISRDHSLVSRLVEMGKITEEEALIHPRRNVLYQALGQGSDVEIHVVQEQLQLNDIVILCSDGLWGEVGEQAIKDVLGTTENPLVAIETLIDMANRTGGADNITAIVIQVSDKEASDASYGSPAQSPQKPTEKDDDTHPSIPAITEPKFEKPDTLPETGPWLD
jgi:protein phosphatase